MRLLDQDSPRPPDPHARDSRARKKSTMSSPIISSTPALEYMVAPSHLVRLISLITPELAGNGSSTVLGPITPFDLTSALMPMTANANSTTLVFASVLPLDVVLEIANVLEHAFQALDLLVTDVTFWAFVKQGRDALRARRFSNAIY